MRLEIKVIPNAAKNMLKQEEGGVVKVYLTAAPVDGKANKALIKFLAKHFNVNKSAIEILKGEKAKHKIINVDKTSN